MPDLYMVFSLVIGTFSVSCNTNNLVYVDMSKVYGKANENSEDMAFVMVISGGSLTNVAEDNS